jgi:hypothetical protein
MPYDNIGQFLKQEALLASEQIYIAINVQDRGIARLTHIKPAFAVRQLQDHFDQAVNAIPKARTASAGGGPC